MTVLYTVNNGLYVNLTNRCSCRCDFCIRRDNDRVGDSGSLWLEHEPGAEEVKALFKGYDLAGYKEIVFCGFGEPTERLDDLLDICRYLRRHTQTPIRLNTNGLAQLRHKKPVAPLLKGLVDVVSISLNAADAENYMKIVHPEFGLQSFDAMLAFAQECKKYLPEVFFTVVDTLPKEEIRKSFLLAEKLGIPLRIRTKV